MNTTKIIFFDIDGTLIDMHKTSVSEKMLETLKKLKQNGIILCLATGRSPLSLPKISGVEFDAFLTYNGSYCFNHEQAILNNPIPKADVKQIIENGVSINRPVSIATKTRLIANGNDQDLIEYYSFANQAIHVAADFIEVVEQDDVYQMMVGCHKKDHEALIKQTHSAKITAWWDRAVDIIHVNSGKGIGVAKILDYYHLNPADALAFGDGNNDLDMFQAVGSGIAMGNGSDELKAVAADICGHVANDGIYHYCREHGLI